MSMILVLLLSALVATQDKQQGYYGYHKNTFPFTRGQPPPEGPSYNDDQPPKIDPLLYSVFLNETILYPKQQASIEPGCLSPRHMIVKPGQKLSVKANSPFLMFFNTQTTELYLSFLREPRFQGEKDKVIKSSIVEAKKQENANDSYSVVMPLNLSCHFVSNTRPHLRMRGKIHVDFQLNPKNEQKITFDFLVICANGQKVQDFNDYYSHVYIILLVYMALSLQVYHGYDRDRSHYVMFLVYLLASMGIEGKTTGYIVIIILLMTVITRQWKENRADIRVFGLYLMLSMLIFSMMMFVMVVEDGESDWNVFSIAVDNFIVLHVSMFMVLRLVKLNRLRYAFWYFVAVAIFALLVEETTNSFFMLSFQNVYDLSCLKKNLFFPIMMLPISNFFTSMTWWMHRIIGVAIVCSSLMPLGWAIRTMALVFGAILAFQIRRHSLDAIKHRY